MKKFIYNNIFNTLTYEQKQEKIDERVTQIYDANKENEDIISKEAFEKKFEDGLTVDEKKYLKNTYLKDYYDQQIKDKREEFMSNLLKKALEKKAEVQYRYEYVEVESEQSKRIREQNEREKKNKKAASEKLPSIIEKTKTDFFVKLKGKILGVKNKIEEVLKKYSPSNLKKFLQNLTEKEKIMNKLIENLKKESEKILNKSYNNSNHFNVLILGKTGIGKSTLINGIFGFNQNEGALEGVGKPITQKFEEFVSDKRKGLRLIDSKGIEMGEYNINSVFNTTKELIEKRAAEGEPDKLIHCIWYCFKSSNYRFEDIEKNTVSLLMNQYDDNNLPIIIVITQNYDDKETEIMTNFINDEFKFLNREITIMPVIAKEKIIEKKKNKLVLEKDGIEELIKISYEKSQKAIYPAIIKSIKEQIIQTFSFNTENNKNKLKDELNEIIQKISNEITEDETMENSISKLSLIVEKTLDIIFEIPLISESGKKDITKFLDNLCKWCIKTLNGIILNLVKENSNELKELLFEEQRKVKIAHTVDGTLSNEKTIDQYRIESEQDLKPSITKKVYFLAIKYFYNIISENIVKMSEEVIKEQFNKILPELRNNISDDKLKEISNKILQEIIKNK